MRTAWTEAGHPLGDLQATAFALGCVLKDGESAEIKFSTAASECKWDMKIVDADKDVITWIGLNLCEANEITLMYQDHKPTAIIK